MTLPGLMSRWMSGGSGRASERAPEQLAEHALGFRGERRSPASRRCCRVVPSMNCLHEHEGEVLRTVVAAHRADRQRGAAAVGEEVAERGDARMRQAREHAPFALEQLERLPVVELLDAKLLHDHRAPLGDSRRAVSDAERALPVARLDAVRTREPRHHRSRIDGHARILPEMRSAGHA